ncbi:cation-dependent mannose-6-phosphate receptor-like [Dreissena polymorpha]|nr:cation-dependent mannose-6-phosphate receptor-like [Dreissena polymorpha]
MLTYENGDPYMGHCKGNGSGPGEKRRAKIMFVCDEGASDVKALQPRVVEEMNNKTMDCFYLFEINTNVVCETRPLITIGLSTGTILIIVFLCVATFYLLAGVIYKRVMLKAKGLEQIPNIDFWKDFGNLEADGCDLVCRSRGARKPREYKGIADAQLDEPDFTANHDDGLLPM